MRNSMKAYRSYYRAFVFAFLVVGAAFASVACSKGGGGGGGTVAPVPLQPGQMYPTVPVTSAGGAVIASAVGDHGQNPGQPGVELVLHFRGVAGPNQYGNYQGSISAVGTLFVSVDYPSCGVYRGRYTIQTTQAGMFQSNQVSNLALIANGPSQIQVLVTSASLDSSFGVSRGMDGGSYPHRFVTYGSPVIMAGVQPAAGGYGGAQCPISFY